MLCCSTLLLNINQVIVITTTGYGDIVPISEAEKIFTIVLFFVGTFVFSIVIVHLQDIVAQLDVTADIFKSRSGLLKALLARECVDDSFIARSSAHMARLWALQRGAHSNEIRSYIPPRHYSAALGEALDSALKKLFFVSTCNADFKAAFVSKLVMHSYLRDDFVFHEGEACHSLRIMFQGEVALVPGEKIDSRRSSHADNFFTPRSQSSLLSGYRDSPVREVREREREVTPRFSSVKQGWDHYVRKSTSVFLGATAASGATTSPGKARPSVSLRLQGSVQGSAQGSVQGSARGGGHGEQSAFAKINDGSLGEFEFFTRTHFACSAQALQNTIMFEIDMTTFCELLREHLLENSFLSQLGDKIGSLEKLSTETAVHKLQRNLSNLKMVKMLLSDVAESKTSWIIVPTSWQSQLWNALQLMVIAYVALTVPYCATFRSSATVTIIAVDAVVIIFTIIDIYAHIRLFAVIDRGQLVTEPAQFSQLYFHNDFLLDVFCTLPIPLLVYSATSSHSSFALSRCVQLIRLYKAGHIFDDLLFSAEHLQGLLVSPDVVKVMKTCILVLLFCHITSCIFCALGSHGLLGPGADSWILRNGFEELEPFSIYLRGMLWSMYSATTVGYGCITLATDSERILAMFVTIFGAVLCNAGVAAVLSSIIANNDQQSSTARLVE